MDLHALFITLGALFLAGLAADTLARPVRVPRVTLLLITGIAVGGGGLGLVPQAVQDWYEALSVIALTMVAFLLGNALSLDNLRRNGRAIVVMSATLVVATMAIVAAGLWLIGVPPEAALLLGAIATATDPAATEDSLQQSKATGRFADTLRGIVALDDAWGLLVFSLALLLAQGLGGEMSPMLIVDALAEIGGAMLLGLVIGAPAAYLTGRLTKGEPLRTEALGIVFLTAGLALWLDVSYLIAGMTAGTIIASFARHHERAFHEIEHLQWPFLLLFFILAGASLRLDVFWAVGAIGLAYVALRILARVLGGWCGARMAHTPQGERRWYGLALLPQAGVAIGMALVAAHHFPDHADIILTITVGSTVVFEVIGPVLAYLAIRQAQSSKG